MLLTIAIIYIVGFLVFCLLGVYTTLKLDETDLDVENLFMMCGLGLIWFLTIWLLISHIATETRLAKKVLIKRKSK